MFLFLLLIFLLLSITLPVFAEKIPKAKIDSTLTWQLLAGLGLAIIASTCWSRQLHRKVEERTSELSDSESRFRATFEQAAVGIAHVAHDGQFLRTNQKFCDIVGYTQEEMVSLSFQEITHPDDLDKDLDFLQELLYGKADSYTMEKRYFRKDSSIVWVNLTVKIVRHNDGSPGWFVSVVEDISERILAAERVRKSYELMQHLTSTMPDAVFSVKIPERKVLWCNDSFNVLGYDPKECIGETTDMFYPGPEEARKVGDLLSKVTSSGENISRTEVLLRHKNGEVFPAEVNLSVYKEEGKAVSVTALVRNISERQQIERELEESHASLNHMISSIPEAVFSVKQPERIIEWAHDSYNVMGFGVNPKHFIGKTTQGYFVDEAEAERFGEMQKKAIQAGESFIRAEVLVRHRNGSIFPAELTGTFYKEHGVVTRTTAMVRDITERKDAEKKVLDYQNRLKALASQLTLAEEKERRSIAADLHDEIGQTLAMTRLQLAAAIRACDCAGTQHHSMLEDISRTLLKAVQDTRQLIFELGSAAIHEVGLGAAIAEWVEEKMKTLDEEIDFDLVDNLTGDLLEEEQRVILFRNIRELLTNIIKHARARKVKIVLESVDHEICITVQDDGLGFNPELVLGDLNQECGYGIFSIEERMADLGGRLEINSAPHKGCTITMSLPIES